MASCGRRSKPTHGDQQRIHLRSLPMQGQGLRKGREGCWRCLGGPEVTPWHAHTAFRKPHCTDVQTHLVFDAGPFPALGCSQRTPTGRLPHKRWAVAWARTDQPPVTTSTKFPARARRFLRQSYTRLPGVLPRLLSGTTRQNRGGLPSRRYSRLPMLVYRLCTRPGWCGIDHQPGGQDNSTLLIVTMSRSAPARCGR